jgi:hypothetical protein
MNGQVRFRNHYHAAHALRAEPVECACHYFCVCFERSGKHESPDFIFTAESDRIAVGQLDEDVTAKSLHGEPPPYRVEIPPPLWQEASLIIIGLTPIPIPNTYGENRFLYNN